MERKFAKSYKGLCQSMGRRMEAGGQMRKGLRLKIQERYIDDEGMCWELV